MTQIITYPGKDIYKLNEFINSPEFINSVTRDIELRCYFGEIHLPKRVDLYTSAIKHSICFNFLKSVFKGKGINIDTISPNPASNLTVKSPILLGIKPIKPNKIKII